MAEDFPPDVGRVTSSPDVRSSSPCSWMGSSEYSQRRLALRSPLIVRLVRFRLFVLVVVAFGVCDWCGEKSLVTTEFGQTTGLLLLDAGCVAGIVVGVVADVMAVDGFDDTAD